MKGDKMPVCVVCSETVEDEEQGICGECKKRIWKALGFSVRYSEKEPYLTVTPANKEPLFLFIEAASQQYANIQKLTSLLGSHTHRQVDAVIFQK